MSLRRTVTAIIGLELIIALTILLHIGENASPGVSLYKFTPLLGAIVGSCLTFFSIRKSALNISAERSEAWIGYEKAGWILVCLAQAMWGLGESFWRYYSAIGDPPFPSLADAGYMFFPALCFIGLVLQPNAKGRLERTLVALDSLIAMGALLAISWYLLLGAIAQSPATTSLAKFISLYYPAADVSLLSCVIFLLMRGHSQVYQATARRFSLFALGLGLCLFATSDFIFNLQQNAGTYVDGTWVDLGWPLGMLTIGLAAYLRCNLPRTAQETLEARRQNRVTYIGFRPVQLLPYTLIFILFIVLILNVNSSDPAQAHIRFVLMLATIVVICLVLVRQILTIHENERLSQLQAASLQQIEEQAHHIAERNKELEEGIAHLKAVQTSLANGNLRARAQLQRGVLWSLASSLNLLADRLTSLGLAKRRLDILHNALIDLGEAIVRYRAGQGFKLPPSCANMPEVAPIVHAIGAPKSQLPTSAPLPSQDLPAKTPSWEISPMRNPSQSM
ncbi:hypothetical protein [Ktedonobacter robiniae]|uniref:HAMP domain-containing protein n=1 Tax=Ktedonobacter robiniae TaxID=2778365 RepID=A0ABQ3UMX6_9CHLR|nr:hypothetical protein [Ktedonobacter robiniae]GHO54065.1 hypothetical protein KSB_25400 [Ktedonobacter robiniae]